MPLNDPSALQTAARYPRLRVLKDGRELAGAIKASVNQSNYYQADHFSVEFAASAGPVGWWDIDPPLMVDVQISIDGAGWVSMIVGEVDHLTLDPVNGLLSCDGRDLSARFIEAKTQEAFVNQTASEVATILAGRHGMTAEVTATTTLVGRYYEQDHSRVTLDQFSRTTTEWDLLVYLAQREGFDCFVSGTTLHFQPSTAPDADPFVVQWTPPSPVPRLNATTLRLERSLTLAKDVQVDVRSWNSRQGRGFTKTAKAIGGRAASASGTTPGGKTNSTQRYVIVRPNLTEDQAQKLATQAAAEITRHERVISLEQPGELILTPRNMVRLQGTGSSFDQIYWIDHIDRSISFEEGFRQSVRLKNSSPRTQTQI